MWLCRFFCCGSCQIWAASKTIHWKIMWNQFPPNLSCLQNNPPENNVEYLAGTCSTLFSSRLFWDQFLLDLRSFLALVLGKNWCTIKSTTGPIYAKSSNFYAKFQIWATSKTVRRKIMWSQFLPNLSCILGLIFFWRRLFSLLVLGANWCTTICTTCPFFAKLSNFNAKLNLSNLNVTNLY